MKKQNWKINLFKKALRASGKTQMQLLNEFNLHDSVLRVYDYTIPIGIRFYSLLHKYADHNLYVPTLEDVNDYQLYLKMYVEKNCKNLFDADRKIGLPRCAAWNVIHRHTCRFSVFMKILEKCKYGTQLRKIDVEYEIDKTISNLLNKTSVSKDEVIDALCELIKKYK